MKIKYRGCDVEVTKEKTYEGEFRIYSSAYNSESGFEILCDVNYPDKNRKLKDWMREAKETVDIYLENQDEWEE